MKLAAVSSGLLWYHYRLSITALFRRLPWTPTNRTWYRASRLPTMEPRKPQAPVFTRHRFRRARPASAAPRHGNSGIHARFDSAPGQGRFSGLFEDLVGNFFLLSSFNVATLAGDNQYRLGRTKPRSDHRVQPAPAASLLALSDFCFCCQHETNAGAGSTMADPLYPDNPTHRTIKQDLVSTQEFLLRMCATLRRTAWPTMPSDRFNGACAHAPSPTSSGGWTGLSDLRESCRFIVSRQSAL